MNRIATAVALLLALATSALADLANPATLALKETSPSRFTVEFTLPIIQGRVLKARPILPDVCVIEGSAEVQEDGARVVRTWAMECDPNDLVGKAIGVDGLLGTSLEVQLTLETLDGRKYAGQLRPTQAYYLIPPSPTLRGLAAEAGGAAARRVLRHPEIAILLLLGVLSGMRLQDLLVSAGVFALSLSFGQWLKMENWIGVSSFLPVMLTTGTGFAIALRTMQRRTECPSVSDGLAIRPTLFGFATTNSLTTGTGRRTTWTTCSVLMALTGLLYGGGGLPLTMVLSRSEQHLALLFSGLGTLAGLALVILCAGQLHAVIGGFRESTQQRQRFWIVYLAGVAACAMGLYQATAFFFVGNVTPVAPQGALLVAIVLGAWCGGQASPLRSFLPGLAGCTVILGMVLGLCGISLPQTTLVVNASLALVGLLLLRPVRLPGWAVLAIVAVSCLYHGAHGGGVLREGVAIPVAHATAVSALMVFLLLVTYFYAEQRSSGGVAVRLLGLTAALLAVWWRLGEYRDWMESEVAVDATMGLIRLPMLTITLAVAALLVWPRRRRFQPTAATTGIPMHWGLVLAALFTVSSAGVLVRNPFYTPRAPTATEARPIVAMLLTDTYLAFNLPEEDAAFDQLARNLSEDLIPQVYLDSRRRLVAGTREGAEVTVEDVGVISVEALRAVDSGGESFTCPCKWVVTARVKHWQHIHHRQNKYAGTLTLRVEDDRWKIGDIELLSEEREIVQWKKS